MSRNEQQSGFERSPDGLFQEAIRLREQGQHEEALALLNTMRRELSDYPAYFLVLGNLQEELSRPDEAVQSYREATELAPQNEMVSLGLFHCLWSQWELGDVVAGDQALAEIRRFLSIRDSDEYRRILKGLHAVIVEGADPEKS